MVPTRDIDSNFDAFLNIEIRHYIYDLIKYDLPPVSNHFFGFALCCRKAVEEMSPYSRYSLWKYLDAIELEFNAKFLCKISVYENNTVPWTPFRLYCVLGQFHDITIEIPAVILLGQPSSEMTAAEVFSVTLLTLYPVFTKPFNRVTILFTDQLGGATLPAPIHFHSEDLVGPFHKYFELARQDLLTVIVHAYYQNTRQLSRYPVYLYSGAPPAPGSVLSELTRLIRPSEPGWGFKRPDLRHPLGCGTPGVRARTRRIGIAWDFWPVWDRHSYVGLEGQCDHVSWPKVASALGNLDMFLPDAYTRFYEVKTSDNRIGEYGLMHDNRWRMHGPEELEAIENPLTVDMFCCHTQGIGKPLNCFHSLHQ